MPAFISIPLASLFVFLAGFNVWTMATQRGAMPRSRKTWTQVHRICGYSFIALYVIFCYFMLLRIRSADELSPRLIVHAGLALILAPLLMVKILLARYQKASWNALMNVGVTIFVIAFTLVSINVAVYYLHPLTPGKITPLTSLTVILAVVVAAATALFARSAGPSLAGASISSPKDSAGKLPGAQRGPLTLMLIRIDPQTHDAKTLRFLLPPSQSITSRPGQFMTFDWTIDGKQVKRSYTLSSSPTQRGFVEITPKRVENGYVSKYLNDQATVGLTVRGHGPYGNFCFDETKHKRAVFIAGGSGITPMISMLRYIDDLCLPVDITLIYCVRTERDIIFGDELNAIQKRVRGFRLVLVLSQPSTEWKGWKGHLSGEILQREIDKPLDVAFFLCGPPRFMELARSLLNEIGVQASSVLQESFGSAVSGERTPVEESAPVEIRLSRSGVTLRMPSDKTVLESLEQNGVQIPFGCRLGSCGTCATRLLSGKVRMENEEALTEDLRAGGFILPCVSKPLGDLTLDA